MARIFRWSLLLLVGLAMTILLYLYLYLNSTEVSLFFNVASSSIVQEEKILSTDLVAHSVYLDRRPGGVWLPKLHLSYSNATVVFISVHKEYRQTIIGCEIDGIQINKTRVVDIAILPFVEKFFNVTHRDCYLYCFDANVNESSKVSVLYSKNDTVVKEPVRSDSVVIPPKNSIEEDEVMVCATGFGVVPYLDQWLAYQKTVGIKFIHLNVNPSFLQNLKKSSALIKSVESGFVRINVWNDYLNSSQVFYYSQSLKYHDCALRYQGVFKYMMVIDFDEYFVPLVSNRTVPYYAKTHIKKNVGTVVLPCQENNKSTILESRVMPSDGNMTKLYDNLAFHMQHSGKSIHLVKAIEQNSVHAALLLSTYRILYYTYSLKSLQSSGCYVAHLKAKEHKLLFS